MLGWPGNVLPDVAAEQPRIDVIAGAGAVADEDAQRLAAVEIGDVGAGGRAAGINRNATTANEKPLKSCASTPHRNVSASASFRYEGSRRSRPSPRGGWLERAKRTRRRVGILARIIPTPALRADPPLRGGTARGSTDALRLPAQRHHRLSRRPRLLREQPAEPGNARHAAERRDALEAGPQHRLVGIDGGLAGLALDRARSPRSASCWCSSGRNRPPAPCACSRASSIHFVDRHADVIVARPAIERHVLAPPRCRARRRIPSRDRWWPADRARTARGAACSSPRALRGSPARPRSTARRFPWPRAQPVRPRPPCLRPSRCRCSGTRPGCTCASPSADAARPTSSSSCAIGFLCRAGHLHARRRGRRCPRGTIAVNCGSVIRFDDGMMRPMRALVSVGVAARDDGVFQCAHQTLPVLESEQPHGVAAEDRLLWRSPTGTADPRSSPARRTRATGSSSPTPAASPR